MDSKSFQFKSTEEILEIQKAVESGRLLLQNAIKIVYIFHLIDVCNYFQT